MSPTRQQRRGRSLVLGTIKTLSTINQLRRGCSACPRGAAEKTRAIHSARWLAVLATTSWIRASNPRGVYGVSEIRGPLWGGGVP